MFWYYFILKFSSHRRPDAEAIHKYISRTEASNFKNYIENTFVELVKQNVLVNKKTKSGYDFFFPYNDNIALPIKPNTSFQHI